MVVDVTTTPLHSFPILFFDGQMDEGSAYRDRYAAAAIDLIYSSFFSKLLRWEILHGIPLFMAWVLILLLPSF